MGGTNYDLNAPLLNVQDLKLFVSIMVSSTGHMASISKVFYPLAPLCLTLLTLTTMLSHAQALIPQGKITDTMTGKMVSYFLAAGNLISLPIILLLSIGIRHHEDSFNELRILFYKHFGFADGTQDPVQLFSPLTTLCLARLTWTTLLSHAQSPMPQ